MKPYKKSDWLIPIGLIILSLVPAIAGSIRLLELSGNPEITAENARFVSMPFPVILHIISATLFCILGAFQFSTGIRNRNLKRHRMSGRILVPFGVVSALTGLWMTQFYPFAGTDGYLLFAIRWVVGVAMVFCLSWGLWQVLQRNIKAHKAWIMRGYALGIGAGTQVLVFIPWILVMGEPSPLTGELLMGFAWLINILFVEYLLRKKPRPKPKPKNITA